MPLLPRAHPSPPTPSGAALTNPPPTLQQDCTPQDRLRLGGVAREEAAVAWGLSASQAPPAPQARPQHCRCEGLQGVRAQKALW